MKGELVKVRGGGSVETRWRLSRDSVEAQLKCREASEKCREARTPNRKFSEKEEREGLGAPGTLEAAGRAPLS
jgi:hypothetical protein